MIALVVPKTMILSRLMFCSAYTIPVDARCELWRSPEQWQINFAVWSDLLYPNFRRHIYVSYAMHTSFFCLGWPFQHISVQIRLLCTFLLPAASNEISILPTWAINKLKQPNTKWTAAKVWFLWWRSSLYSGPHICDGTDGGLPVLTGEYILDYYVV